MYIISGCNGSGKTTASYTLLPEMLECNQFVNSDEFAKSLSPFNPSEASVSASRYMLQKIYYLLGNHMDFCVETTLATRSLMGIINDVAIARVKSRVEAGGHNIPENVVRRRYYMGLNYFFETYAPVCDRWMLADNSSSPFSIVAEGSPAGIKVRDKEKYDTILRLAYPDENEK